MPSNSYCPVCGSNNTFEFLRREKVPVHQNLLVADQDEARNINFGSLCMYCCKNCSFIYNHCFDPDKLSYGDHYDNSQEYSTYFNNYLKGLAKYLLQKKEITASKIVEVGCGKGNFLRLLVSDGKRNNIGYGFDPSYVGPVSDLNNRLNFEKRFYGKDCADLKADIVVCRHVIEHVPDPIELLDSIRFALMGSCDAKVFFETPCAEWILENKVIWDFFYEHCSMFTVRSLATAFQLSGFQVTTAKKVFGGQYLWLEAVPASGKIKEINKYFYNRNNIEALAYQFAERENELIVNWIIKIKKLAENGKLAVWGGGAKGVTFVQLVDPECKYIECIIDLNPNKQGKFLPGSGHPIIGIKEAGKMDIKYAILMNPNYFEENTQLILKERVNLKLITC